MNSCGKCSLCHMARLKLTCKNMFSWFLDFSRNFWSMDLNGSLLSEGSWTFFKEGKHWQEKQKKRQVACGVRVLSCVIGITSQNMQQLNDSSHCHSNPVRDMAESHCRLRCTKIRIKCFLKEWAHVKKSNVPRWKQVPRLASCARPETRSVFLWRTSCCSQSPLYPTDSQLWNKRPFAQHSPHKPRSVHRQNIPIKTVKRTFILNKLR